MSAVKQKTKSGLYAAKGWSKPSETKRRRDEREANRTMANYGAIALGGGLGPLSSASVIKVPEGSDLLMRRATDELRRVQTVMVLDDERRQEHLRELITHLYALSMDGRRNEERHKQRLEQTKIATRADTPFHKQTVRAVLAEAAIKVKKSTEHEWSQVLTALEHDGVAETGEAVEQWLREEVEVQGTRCRGFNRAEVTLRKSKKLKNARQQARQERDAEEQAMFTHAVTDGSCFGMIEPSDGAVCPDGLWLSINRAGQVLRQMLVSDKELRDLVLKHARER